MDLRLHQVFHSIICMITLLQGSSQAIVYPNMISAPDKPTKVFVGDTVSFRWHYNLGDLKDDLYEVVFGIWKSPGFLKTKLIALNSSGFSFTRPNQSSVGWAGNLTASIAVFELHNVTLEDDKTYGILIDYGIQYTPLTDTVELQVESIHVCSNYPETVMVNSGLDATLFYNRSTYENENDFRGYRAEKNSLQFAHMSKDESKGACSGPRSDICVKQKIEFRKDNQTHMLLVKIFNTTVNDSGMYVVWARFSSSEKLHPNEKTAKCLKVIHVKVQGDVCSNFPETVTVNSGLDAALFYNISTYENGEHFRVYHAEKDSLQFAHMTKGESKGDCSGPRSDICVKRKIEFRKDNQMHLLVVKIFNTTVNDSGQYSVWARFSSTEKLHPDEKTAKCLKVIHVKVEDNFTETWTSSTPQSTQVYSFNFTETWTSSTPQSTQVYNSSSSSSSGPSSLQKNSHPFLWLAIGFGVLALFVIGFVYFRNRQNKRKQKIFPSEIEMAPTQPPAQGPSSGGEMVVTSF